MPARDGLESETTTEVLVKLIDSCYTGDPLRALQEALAKVRGSYALSKAFGTARTPSLQSSAKARSSGWGGENCSVGYPGPAWHTCRYSVLATWPCARPRASASTMEFAEPVQRPATADWDMEAAEKGGGYPHFMPWRDETSSRRHHATVSSRRGRQYAGPAHPAAHRMRAAQHRYGIWWAAAAMHAGMVGKAAIETLARCPPRWTSPASSGYRDPILNPNDSVIIISQSGETSDTLAAPAGKEPGRAGAGYRERGG